MIAELGVEKSERIFATPKKKKKPLTKEKLEILRQAAGSISTPNVDLNKIKEFYINGGN